MIVCHIENDQKTTVGTLTVKKEKDGTYTARWIGVSSSGSLNFKADGPQTTLMLIDRATTELRKDGYT